MFITILIFVGLTTLCLIVRRRRFERSKNALLLLVVYQLESRAKNIYTLHDEINAAGYWISYFQLYHLLDILFEKGLVVKMERTMTRYGKTYCVCQYSIGQAIKQ